MLCGLVIPYFVYELLYYLLYTFILDKETGFYFTRPKFSLWYLMALFAWRLLSPLIEKIPGCMVLSVIAGILIGFTDFGNFLSIPRILFFFPFFLAGKKFDSSSLARFRNRRDNSVRGPSWEVLPSFYLLTSNITRGIRRISMDDTLTQIWI